MGWNMSGTESPRHTQLPAAGELCVRGVESLHQRQLVNRSEAATRRGRDGRQEGGEGSQIDEIALYL